MKNLVTAVPTIFQLFATLSQTVTKYNVHNLLPMRIVALAPQDFFSQARAELHLQVSLENRIWVPRLQKPNTVRNWQSLYLLYTS